MLRSIVLLTVLLALLSACRQGPAPLPPANLPETAVAGGPLNTPTAVLSPTASSTPTATPTPSPTLTPSPTPTPTATAQPMTAAGDPRAGRLRPPVPQGSAPCGVVDILDFPLNPPDGAEVRGGHDFGVFRDRYGKYHAGEDWGWRRGSSQSSFGQPVYSIGHGLVTYAEPLGWNRDQGVVIIQHTFADGRTLLSFYGHLDPPSIVLTPGTCVARGEQVGQIGRPRTSPHLHFEIRTQSPYAPLTGYWPDDPAGVGWLPPSQTIWEQRLATAPGVRWTRPSVAGTQAVGPLDEDTFLVMENGHLAGINAVDGAVRWQYEASGDIANAAFDGRQPTLYVIDRSGQLQALSLLDAAGAVGGIPVLTVQWRLQLDTMFGTPALIPRPDGGVVVSVRQQLFGITPDGIRQWQERTAGRLMGWATHDDQLFLSTTGGDASLWQIDARGARPWEIAASGSLVSTGSALWLFGADGLYRLDAASRTATLHYPLAPGTPAGEDAVILPDGGLLIATVDQYDRRLIAFNADGSLRWERSYKDSIRGDVRLVSFNGEIYLVVEENGSSATHLGVYRLDLNTVTPIHIFAGGTRSPNPTDSWVYAARYLFINVGGGHMLALDPVEAGGAVMLPATQP